MKREKRIEWSGRGKKIAEEEYRKKYEIRELERELDREREGDE